MSGVARQAQGKMVDTPAPVIVAGVGSFFGLLAGVPCWCRMPHLTPEPEDDKTVEKRRDHFKRILVKLSRVSLARLSSHSCMHCPLVAVAHVVGATRDSGEL